MVPFPPLPWPGAWAVGGTVGRTGRGACPFSGCRFGGGREAGATRPGGMGGAMAGAAAGPGGRKFCPAFTS